MSKIVQSRFELAQYVVVPPQDVVAIQRSFEEIASMIRAFNASHQETAQWSNSIGPSVAETHRSGRTNASSARVIDAIRITYRSYVY